MVGPDKLPGGGVTANFFGRGAQAEAQEQNRQQFIKWIQFGALHY
jgi:hypothetical protein